MYLRSSSVLAFQALFSSSVLYPLVQCSPAHLNYSHMCRVLPGDAAWPDAATWSHFNSSIGGSLIATIPEAAPCHDPHFDEAACQTLKAEWDLPLGQYEPIICSWINLN